MTEVARARAGLPGATAATEAAKTPPPPAPIEDVPSLTPAQKAAIDRDKARSAAKDGPAGLPPKQEPGEPDIEKVHPPEETTSIQELASLQTEREVQRQVKATAGPEPTPAQNAAIERNRARAGAGGPPPPRPPAPPTGGAAGPPEPPRRPGGELTPEAQRRAEEAAGGKLRDEFTEGHVAGIYQGERHRAAMQMGHEHWGRVDIPLRVDGAEEVKEVLDKAEGGIFEILTFKNARKATKKTPAVESEAKILKATTTPPEDYHFKLPLGAIDEKKATHNLVTLFMVDPDNAYLLDEAGEYVVRSFHVDELLEAEVNGRVYQFIYSKAKAGTPKGPTRAVIPPGRRKPEPIGSELAPPEAPAPAGPGLEDVIREPGSPLTTEPSPPLPRKPPTGQMTLEDLYGMEPNAPGPWPTQKVRPAPPRTPIWAGRTGPGGPTPGPTPAGVTISLAC